MDSRVQRRLGLADAYPGQLRGTARHTRTKLLVDLDSRGTRLAVLALAILSGLGLRLYLLGSESFWLDESTSLVVSRLEPNEILRWVVRFDVQPPFYYILLHYWLALGDSEFALRLLSALIGTLSLVAIYYLAAELFDVGTAVYAAFLMAISPVHIQFSQETRAYSLLTLIGIVSGYALIQLLRRGAARYWIGYAALATLGMYTHYFFAFVIAAQNLYAWAVFIRNGGWSRLQWWFLCQGMVLAAFLPLFVAWLPALGDEFNSPVRFSSPAPSVKALAMTFMDFGIGTTLEERAMRFPSYAVIGILATFPLWRTWRDGHSSRSARWGRSSVLFSLLYALVPVLCLFVFSQFKPSYLLRYLIPALPGFLLILALGIRTLERNELKIALVVFIVVASAFSLRTYYAGNLKDDWRGAAGYVTGRAEPGDIVLFSPRYNYKPFAYYSRKAVELYEDMSLFVDKSTVEEELAPVIADHRRLWIVRTWPFSDRNGEIPEYLDARFPRVEEAWFRGVGEIILYDLARPPSTSGKAGSPLGGQA